MIRGAFFSVIIALGVLLASCGSPIVGAECKKGYVACDGECVNLASDPYSCGTCGHSCGKFTCSAGKCSKTLQPDAGMDAGMMEDGGGNPRDTGTMPVEDAMITRPDATTGRGGIGSPFLPDGGIKFPDPGVTMMGCGIGQTKCDGVCVDTRYDTQHCGDCDTKCGTNPEQYCKLGTCTNFCDPPLTRCNGACVDLQTDEMHCGGCNTVCISGLCNAGVCADVIPGHLVVIGHDYFTAAPNSSKPSTLQQLAGNAVFSLARPSLVRALVYEGGADKASIANVNEAISRSSAGRQWQATQADPDRVSEQLRDADAFIIYAQTATTDGQLVTLGQKWGMSMAQFLLRGGVVVMFENASNANIGTYRLLQPSGLFQASGRQALAVPATVYVNKNDGIAYGLTSKYSATKNSVSFSNIITLDGIVVVSTQADGSGNPVVFHRVISPPP